MKTILTRLTQLTCNSNSHAERTKKLSICQPSISCRSAVYMYITGWLCFDVSLGSSCSSALSGHQQASVVCNRSVMFAQQHISFNPSGSSFKPKQNQNDVIPQSTAECGDGVMPAPICFPHRLRSFACIEHGCRRIGKNERSPIN